MDVFEKFIENLREDPRASRVAANLKRQGVDLGRVFVMLKVYSEGRPTTAGRKKRGKQQASIVNRGVRQYGVSPAIGKWLLDRSELAHSTNGLPRAHNIDSLASTIIYIDCAIGHSIAMSDLAYLVEATNRAIERRPFEVDPETLGREFRRYRIKNARFIHILRKDILAKLLPVQK